jgi:hypothetical protein
MTQQFDLIVLGSGSGAHRDPGLKLGATVDDLAHMHHAFPTFGEGVKAAAEQAV